MGPFPDSGMVWVVNPYCFADSLLQNNALENMMRPNYWDNLAFYNAMMEHVIL